MLPDLEDVYVGYPNSTHVNKIICFNGTVTKTFTTRILESSQIYMCIKCGYQFSIKIDYSQADLIVKPAKCPAEACKSDKFKLINSESSKIIIHK